jgi:transcriptional regulator with XRE-family HTH domain
MNFETGRYRRDSRVRKDVRFSDVLRRERARLGRSQAEMAEALGVKRQTYLQWERRRRTPVVEEQERVLTLMRVLPPELGTHESKANHTQAKDSVSNGRYHRDDHGGERARGQGNSAANEPDQPVGGVGGAPGVSGSGLDGGDAGREVAGTENAEGVQHLQGGGKAIVASVRGGGGEGSPGEFEERIEDLGDCGGPSGEEGQ